MKPVSKYVIEYSEYFFSKERKRFHFKQNTIKDVTDAEDTNSSDSSEESSEILEEEDAHVCSEISEEENSHTGSEIPDDEVNEKCVKAGAYMLVKLQADGARNLTYRYVVVAQTDIEEDGEVTVMSLKTVTNARKLFKTVDNDIFYVHFDQILKILPEPKLKLIGGRLYYEFPCAIDVFQKA